MKLEEAVQIIDKSVANLNGTRQDHQILATAVTTIANTAKELDALKEKLQAIEEKEKKNGDKPNPKNDKVS
jgi:cell division protein ZapA (FtsZ GTPase activity inhibitor)